MICPALNGKYNPTKITTGGWGLTLRINHFVLQHAGNLAAESLEERIRHLKLEARDLPTLMTVVDSFLLPSRASRPRSGAG